MVVLEVGLGGRLDATNVVHPEFCVITPVDFDHEAFLGKSLESIAGEKAGILKPGVPAVFARQRPEAARVLERRAADLGVPVRRTGDLAGSRPGTRSARGSSVSGRMACAFACPLAGEHQVENAVDGGCAHCRHSACRRPPSKPASRSPMARPPGTCWRSIPRSSSTARTIRRARARWPHTSSASTPGGACA